MRILHVIPSFYPAKAYGGPCVTVYELARMMAALGHHVRVLTTDADGRNRLDVAADLPMEIDGGISVTYCRRNCGKDISLSLMRKLRQHINWAERVILSGIFCSTTFPTLMLCRYLEKELVWLPHGALMKTCLSQKPRRKRLWNRACRFVCHRARGFRFVTTSTMEGRDCGEVFPELPVSIIPHSVVTPGGVAPVEPFEEMRLLYLGRLHPIKGVENLIRAVSLVRGQCPSLPWKLKIAGSGDIRYERLLKALVESLDLHQEVMFTGPVFGEPKEQLFRECNVVMVPSYSENFCAVVGESLARARPVITTTGVPWEGLRAHGCGLRVEPTPAALSEAIIRISGCDLRSMGLAGREWVSEEFSSERLSHIWDQVLSPCVAPPT